MIVVADSSPLIALANIERIGLLPAMYGRVLIPDLVLSELQSPKRPRSISMLFSQPPSWVEVRTVVNAPPIPKLDPGEVAAITLASVVAADQLLIDELKGRREAIGRGISVIGTVGILVAAAREARIDLALAFAALRATNFWIAPAILDEQLARFREWEANQDQ